MYSCNNSDRRTLVQLKTISFEGFKSSLVCRFDLRYTEMHQKLGCEGCTRQWDHEYLRQQGLIT